MVLYYVHDPMCSWCWGFKPTWEKIQAELISNITVKYILGGLAPDSDEIMPAKMQADIAGYWKNIQQRIPNTQFNFDFWKKCEPRRSTYPACRAVIATRKQNSAFEKIMIEGIQTAYYLQAKNPSDDNVLTEIAVSLGCDRDLFLSDLNAEATQNILAQEISFSQKIGVQGFPSMILEVTGEYKVVPLNYNNASFSVAFIESLM